MQLVVVGHSASDADFGADQLGGDNAETHLGPTTVDGERNGSQVAVLPSRLGSTLRGWFTTRDYPGLRSNAMSRMEERYTPAM